LVYQVTLEIHHLIQGRNAGYLTSTLPAQNTCGLMAVLAIVAAPIPHVLAIGLLPDTLLTPLSLGLMLMALRWLSKEHFSVSDWVFTGILLGLSGLSKYTAAFSAFALLLVFLSSPRKNWINTAGFWLAAIIALFCISPVLYWNWTNDWISFKYQIAHGAGSTWLWRKLAAYVGLDIWFTDLCCYWVLIYLLNIVCMVRSFLYGHCLDFLSFHLLSSQHSLAAEACHTGQPQHGSVLPPLQESA
jgi:hypothetical protein